MTAAFGFERPQHHDGTHWGNRYEPPPPPFIIRWAPFGRLAVAWFLEYIAPVAVLVALGQWSYFLYVPFLVLDNVILQGITGRTLGKRLMGLQLCWVPSDSRDPTTVLVLPGILRCGVRFCAHALDWIGLIGWIRAMFHPQSRTFADSIVRTSTIWDDRIAPLTRNKYEGRVQASNSAALEKFAG